MSKHQWLDKNYDNIVQWAKNICKNDELAFELAHYSIEKFITHKRYEEITNRHEAEPKHGHCRGFILAIMRNSWIGAKSEFSRIHKAHRADIGNRKREVKDEKFDQLYNEIADEEYDHDKDRLIEAIEGLLEEMTLDHDKLWYSGKLFLMYLEDSNYSSLSRKTDIPRTSISNAVNEAREYIINELNIRKII